MKGAIPDGGFWRGRRVFVTGHTGFVGGWLCAWLAGLGARVHGFSLAPPTTPSFFEVTGLASRLAASELGDVRDLAAVRAAIERCDPQVLFHLAAQPIVRDAYRDPVATYATNVMGTVNVLEAARACPKLERVLVYTTDKVYRNDQSGRAFREDDRLGGNEPYSASKAAADWAASAYWETYFSGDKRRAMSVVRAGNIVGGGDWGRDRLLPDAVRAFSSRAPLVVRNPAATRPWQHVLDAVRGTLLLAERGEGDAEGSIAWNFGPAPSAGRPVAELVNRAVEAWGDGATWRHEPDATIPESQTLAISSEKARERLGWRCAWDLERAVDESVAWYKEAATAKSARLLAITDAQIAAHVADASAP